MCLSWFGFTGLQIYPPGNQTFRSGYRRLWCMDTLCTQLLAGSIKLAQTRLIFVEIRIHKCVCNITMKRIAQKSFYHQSKFILVS